jgi:hypothetical protein
MKKLIGLLFILSSFSAYAQMNTFGGIGLRVNDSTTYVTNAAVYHTAGYRDIFFNNQATHKHWDIWNGSSYQHVFSFGSGTGSGSGGGSLNTFAANVQTGNYSLTNADTVKIIKMRSASAQTLTIPTGLKVGALFTVQMDSTGVTTLSFSSSPFVSNPSGNLTLANKQVVQLYQYATKKWSVFKTDAAGGGTVTSVTSANSDATVATSTTTPVITIVSAPKWTTGRTVAITGDLAYTSSSLDGSGNVTAAGTLATVNSNVGSFGSATQVMTQTVNAKGLTTAAANVTITPAVGSITGLGTGNATALAVNVSSTGAFITDANTVTLTNKRITPRVQSVTSSATVTPSADNDDVVKITAQAAGLTLANPSGTPTAMQAMVIRLKDNGTARSITYGSQYRGIGITLPTTTVISKIIYFGLVWNSDDSKWDVVGYSFEN